MELNLNRLIDIKFKIINLEDLRSIVKLIEEKFEKCPSRSKNFRITIHSDDNMSLTGNASSIFEDHQVKLMKINRIMVQFSSYDPDYSISMNLNHGNYSSSTISIDSSDRQWVNDAYVSLLDKINKLRPQFELTFNRAFLFSIVLILPWAIFLFNSLLNILYFFFKEHMNSLPSTLVDKILNIYLPATFICIWLSPFLTSKLMKLFPCVELQIGPEHLLIEKRKRNLIWGIITLVILPIILNWRFQ